MRQINDFENIQAAGESTPLPAGGYIIKITKVTDHPNNEYLECEYDIADGEFKGYFENRGFPGKFYKSYKAKALPFFKGFITAVEDTCGNFKFSFDEKQLERKFVGVVLGEEEYRNNEGEIKVRLTPTLFVKGQRIRSGDFKVPPLKKLTEKVSDPVQKPSLNASAADFVYVDDDLLPF